MLFTVLSLGSVVVPGIVSSKAYAESVPVTEVYDKETNRLFIVMAIFSFENTKRNARKSPWYYNSIVGELVSVG